ncbi:MAG TPA: ABC transporter ATP-binding protein [Prolixibacteraceae bacterium]|nr:ABC transporter ATP-binding protein [Prolixibacteraceae bacterium]
MKQTPMINQLEKEVPTREAAIRIQNLTRYYDDFKAVDGVTFDIDRNEIFGLLGPNGAGKTTTISMICGLLPASEGTIGFSSSAGRDPKSIIGYCPQENIFYPKLTCMEQIIFIGQLYNLPSKRVKARASELLEVMGLTGKAHVRASKLSGGMKRRLNICMALIHDPEILILDEPEAGLDPQSRILVRDFIRSVGKKKTVILTTHNMDEADRLADRVAIIDHGKLLMLDTPSNLKKTIGEGDILELLLSNATPDEINRFIEQIANHTLKATVSDELVLIKHPGIIEKLPEIKRVAEVMGLTIGEIKLRENSLEDVFIHLTGRKLRQ